MDPDDDDDGSYGMRVHHDGRYNAHHSSMMRRPAGVPRTRKTPALKTELLPGASGVIRMLVSASVVAMSRGDQSAHSSFSTESVRCPSSNPTTPDAVHPQYQKVLRLGVGFENVADGKDFPPPGGCILVPRYPQIVQPAAVPGDGLVAFGEPNARLCVAGALCCGALPVFHQAVIDLQHQRSHLWFFLCFTELRAIMNVLLHSSEKHPLQRKKMKMKSDGNQKKLGWETIRPIAVYRMYLERSHGTTTRGEKYRSATVNEP